MKKGQKLVPEEKRRRNLIAVRLADAELESLELIADREDLPVAHLVREGIKYVIKKHLKR